jgi:hypothetical protein
MPNSRALTLTYDVRIIVNAGSRTRHSLVSLEWTVFCGAETSSHLSRCIEDSGSFRFDHFMLRDADVLCTTRCVSAVVSEFAMVSWAAVERRDRVAAIIAVRDDM